MHGGLDCPWHSIQPFPSVLRQQADHSPGRTGWAPSHPVSSVHVRSRYLLPCGLHALNSHLHYPGTHTPVPSLDRGRCFAPADPAPRRGVVSGASPAALLPPHPSPHSTSTSASASASTLQGSAAGTYPCTCVPGSSCTWPDPGRVGPARSLYTHPPATAWGGQGG